MNEQVKRILKKAVPLVSCLCFLVLLGTVFSHTLYLFRNTSNGRYNILGIRQEQQKLDMVYVGGSAAYVYFQPLRAWNDYGFASYDYANDAIQAECIEAYIRDIRRYQDPELFVIDARAFQYYTSQEDGIGLRYGADSMDWYDPNRYRLLNSYFQNRDISPDTDTLSYYLDIAKYHTNTENLSHSINWRFSTGKMTASLKGWCWMHGYTELDTPPSFSTEVRGELASREILTQLLEYGKQENLNFLFVVCPYYITQQHQELYNSIADLVESYGYSFLNTNEHWAEMGIDFSNDFYNKNHVNPMGAAKYTQYLANYLQAQYDLPDHRQDAAYASWDSDYQRFLREEADCLEIISQNKARTAQTKDYGARMRQTEDLTLWQSYAFSDDFTLLAVSGEVSGVAAESDAMLALRKFDLAEDPSWQIRVFVGTETFFSNKISRAPFSSYLGHYPMDCQASAEDGTVSVVLNGQSLTVDPEAITLIALDNWRGVIADTLTIRFDAQGNTILTRIPNEVKQM